MFAAPSVLFNYIIKKQRKTPSFKYGDISCFFLGKIRGPTILSIKLFGIMKEQVEHLFL
jgi:hypothetical protein